MLLFWYKSAIFMIGKKRFLYQIKDIVILFY